MLRSMIINDILLDTDQNRQKKFNPSGLISLGRKQILFLNSTPELLLWDTDVTRGALPAQQWEKYQCDWGYAAFGLTKGNRFYQANIFQCLIMALKVRLWENSCIFPKIIVVGVGSLSVQPLKMLSYDFAAGKLTAESVPWFKCFCRIQNILEFYSVLLCCV